MNGVLRPSEDVVIEERGR